MEALTMKRLVLLPFVLTISVSLFACNSGGGSSGSQVSLPAGSYLATVSNQNPANCAGDESSVVFTTNGNGSICNSGECMNLNLATNPCISKTVANTTETWSSCVYNSSIQTMTSIMNVTGAFNCTANLTLVQVATE